MYIQSTNDINFKAKFIRNESYDDVMRYAIKRNKYEILNSALKNIDYYANNTANNNLASCRNNWALNI